MYDFLFALGIYLFFFVKDVVEMLLCLLFDI